MILLELFCYNFLKAKTPQIAFHFQFVQVGAVHASGRGRYMHDQMPGHLMKVYGHPVMTVNFHNPERKLHKKKQGIVVNMHTIILKYCKKHEISSKKWVQAEDNTKIGKKLVFLGKKCRKGT
jgi:hypothetical protein